MKKLIISLLTLLIMSAVSVGATPEYAKWGKVAVEVTQKRYSADIIDYKHISRTHLTTKKSEEKFKLWIRNKEGIEFGVYVSIQFDPSTEIIQSIQFSE
ncbi:YqzG/YhdC family protein [Paenibacillus endoradicis]|uniref:YqzG/YhdC family protein n=1 Tax=Paenibacillus endoradicis TaxID=2972487 RepID=UPI002158E47C|nr:YqzG/YhdC family protein [Paenibacillus endoradicis]MCR8658799.1 YqzG/YhdC family protein [Paenibacillus endoradicis]